jgi:predicted metal-dependent hydrolase
VKNKKINIPGVGEVLLERSGRAKHMNLSIRPLRGVRVAMPVYVSFAAAEKFARSKTGWLMKHLPKIKALEKEMARRRRDMPADRIDPAAARKIIVERLDELSQKFGLPYNRAFVRNQKTRWGSCSAKKNINLNVNLVRLPEALMDYAILHELAHTRELNHGLEFWNLLECFIPDARELDHALRQFSFLLAR